MKYLLFLITLLCVCKQAQSQTNWISKEDSLGNLLFRETNVSRHDQQTWQFFVKETGYIPPLGLRQRATNLVNDKNIDTLPLLKKTVLYLLISDNQKNLIENPSDGLKLYIFNVSTKQVAVPSIGTAPQSLIEYIFVENKWIVLRRKAGWLCRKPRPKIHFLPNTVSCYNISPVNQENGTITLKYKIMMSYNNQSIESNQITIKLYSNQLQRLLEENN
ncbi:hypothetical protein [Flectobacillus roseus]|uniref:Uncharacterized protein n=1 Tax=Flectobacillus roseus TaxID=502259 RepID=A0ABT6Y4F4_9BACT|nr:hypothetical protein [Flectobacillus roseus]MDI9858161.1 hypothetical protein [Flectobacillus roseus]